VTWYLMFLVNDAYAKKRYHYIVSTLQTDKNVNCLEESIDGDSRELTVVFRPGCNQPQNPSFHHLNQVYGTTYTFQRLSPVDRILTASCFDG
jgi:hypothetical protein